METKYFFTAELFANIEITDEEFLIIKNSMLHHYDLTVRSSAEYGGFWYGFNNWRQVAKESTTKDPDDNICKLSQRQLHIVLKSLEMARSEEARFTSSKLCKIMRKLHEKFTEINKKLMDKRYSI